MRSTYLGRIHFHEALRAEKEMYHSLQRGGEGLVMGFESEPVVTLGLRAKEEVDLAKSRIELERQGFSVVRVDRGGQATLHHPGQLVIFPLIKVGAGRTRAWVEVLARTSEQVLKHYGVDCAWDSAKPGIYSPRGKIASVGVRLRQGINTHGIAINVDNDPLDFKHIRACGVDAAPMDRLRDWAAPVPSLEGVFHQWMEHFQRLWPAPGASS